MTLKNMFFEYFLIGFKYIIKYLSFTFMVNKPMKITIVTYVVNYKQKNIKIII